MRLHIIRIIVQLFLELFPILEYPFILFIVAISMCLPDEGIEVVNHKFNPLSRWLGNFWVAFPFHFLEFLLLNWKLL